MTTITRAEIRYGIAHLPRGKRRTRLEQSADDLFAEVADRMLAFDSVAADRFGELVVARERAGRPISVPDAQIAAIALANHASVATADAGGFEGCGIPVIDPFVGG